MAGRRQHRQRERLPKYVYLAKGRYIPFQGGRRGKEVILCQEKASLKELWDAYEAVTRTEDRGTLRWLSDQYLASPAFAKKADRTRRDYRRYHESIMRVPLKDSRPFGATCVDEITPGVIAAYRDKRGEDKAPVTGNRELAYLSLIFSWGYERELVSSTRSKASNATRSRPESATWRTGNTSWSTA